jgi:ABC-2 type transport system ATP-binding protein
VTRPAIELNGVRKRFGAVDVLDGVSFSVESGELCGFVGANGSGKTTTLRLITGYLAPDAGQVRVEGETADQHRPAVCARIGYMPEAVPLYSEMRTGDFLRYRARLKGVQRAELAARVEAALERAQLGAMRERVIATLSRGYRQRVGLADALVAGPSILLLDEPTAGLDPLQVREFRELVSGLITEGQTVLFSSHVLPEIEALGSRVIILATGRVVGDGRKHDLVAQAGVGADATLEEVFVALSAGPATAGSAAR